MRQSLELLALVLIPLGVAAGCGIAGFGETAPEVLETLGSDLVTTMPNPKGSDGMSTGAFWTTWGVTLLVHEGRKLVRWIFDKEKTK